jgi:hypothetical protein
MDDVFMEDYPVEPCIFGSTEHEGDFSTFSSVYNPSPSDESATVSQDGFSTDPMHVDLPFQTAFELNDSISTHDTHDDNDDPFAALLDESLPPRHDSYSLYCDEELSTPTSPCDSIDTENVETPTMESGSSNSPSNPSSPAATTLSEPFMAPCSDMEAYAHGKSGQAVPALSAILTRHNTTCSRVATAFCTVHARRIAALAVGSIEHGHSEALLNAVIDAHSKPGEEFLLDALTLPVIPLLTLGIRSAAPSLETVVDTIAAAVFRAPPREEHSVLASLLSGIFTRRPRSSVLPALLEPMATLLSEEQLLSMYNVMLARVSGGTECTMARNRGVVFFLERALRTACAYGMSQWVKHIVAHAPLDHMNVQLFLAGLRPHLALFWATHSPPVAHARAEIDALLDSAIPARVRALSTQTPLETLMSISPALTAPNPVHVAPHTFVPAAILRRPHVSSPLPAKLALATKHVLPMLARRSLFSSPAVVPLKRPHKKGTARDDREFLYDSDYDHASSCFNGMRRKDRVRKGRRGAAPSRVFRATGVK